MKEEERKSEYQKFIKDKHERLFNTSDEIINEFILQATGAEMSIKERIIKGEANEVYLVKNTDGQEVVIRISHNEDSRFEAEKWAIEQASERGVPVPEVIMTDKKTINKKIYTVCVEKVLPGIPLKEVENITENEKYEYIKQAGKILSKIHSIKIDGYGKLDANGKGEHSSMKEVLLNKYINESVLLKIADDISVDEKIIHRAFDLLRQGAESYQDSTPVLIHNDYAPKHIMVKSEKITGILDWEIAEGGDPVREFARWDFFFGESYPYQFLMEGYGNKALFSGNFNERFYLWKIYLGLIHLRYYYDEKNNSGLELSKRRIVEDIANYK